MSHVFPLPQEAGSKIPREGINSNAPMHSIMVGEKGKTIRFSKING